MPESRNKQRHYQTLEQKLKAFNAELEREKGDSVFLVGVGRVVSETLKTINLEP